MESQDLWFEEAIDMLTKESQWYLCLHILLAVSASQDLGGVQTTCVDFDCHIQLCYGCNLQSAPDTTAD